MTAKNLFWPFVISVFACIVGALVLLVWAAVVGVITLANTAGAIFTAPLLALGVFGILGILAVGSMFRNGLGS